MYKTTAKLMASNKRVGFEFRKADGTTIRLLDAKILSLMGQGQIFDLTYNKRGFQFRDKKRKIGDLREIDIPLKSLGGVKTSKIILDEYTGNRLKSFVYNSGVIKFKHRNFVRAINEYLGSRENRVLSISGLRGTGKTTGLIQAILALNDYDNVVFIVIDNQSDMNCLDLRNLLLEKYKNKKYIFIDEITRIKDLINNSGFLADNFCMNGRKVVISGTDSLALTHSKNAGLYHRVIDINVTHISYKEARVTANQSLKEYIEVGGLYKAQEIVGLDGLRDYVDTAIVDNIMNTLSKNSGVTSLLNLRNLSLREIRTLVFRIVYAIVYMNTQKIRPTSVKMLIDLYDKSSLYSNEELNTLVCSQVGVDEAIRVALNQVNDVLKALESLGLVISIANIANGKERSYYITNPSITNQLLRSIITILDNTKLPRKNNSTIKRMNGMIFESVVVKHNLDIAKIYGNSVYYYHDNNDREIDLIVEKQTGDAFEDLYLYYEIKMTSDSDTAILKTKWLNNSYIASNLGGTVVERAIIYGGQSKRFTGFEDKNIYPPKGMSLDAVKKLNNNTRLINAEEYLLHTRKYLSVLENYNV